MKISDMIKPAAMGALALTLAVVLGPGSADAQLKLPTLKMSAPVDVGPAKCQDKYPATKKYDRARQKLLQPICFSCPVAYEFNPYFALDGLFHCQAKKGSKVRPDKIDIVIRGKLDCANGWERKGRCLKCPEGYTRNKASLKLGKRSCIQIKR